MLENSRHTPSCKRSENFLALVFAKKPHILPPYHRQEKGLPPAIRLYQYNRTHLTHPKGSDNKSFLSVQLLQIVYQTDLLLRLCQQTGSFSPGIRYTTKGRFCRISASITVRLLISSSIIFFFITLLTTRTEDTSLFVEVKTSTFHT